MRKKEWGKGFMADAKLNAVTEKELRDFLKSLGELERVEAGMAICAFCDRPISTQNIHAIIPEEKEVKYCCDSSICIAKMSWG